MAVIYTEERAREIAQLFYPSGRGGLPTNFQAMETLAFDKTFDARAVLEAAELMALTPAIRDGRETSDGVIRGHLRYLKAFGRQQLGLKPRAGIFAVAKDDVTSALEEASLDQDLLLPEFEVAPHGFGFAVLLTTWQAMTFGAELVNEVAKRKVIEKIEADAHDATVEIRRRLRYAQVVYGAEHSREAIVLFPYCVLVDNSDDATV